MDPRDLGRRAIRLGLLGGGTIVFLALVGMVQEFDRVNLLEDVFTMASLLIVLPPLLVGYLGTVPRTVGGRSVAPAGLQAVAAGAATGLTSGIVVAAFVGVVHVLGVERVRDFFVSVKDPLIDILSFGRGIAVGMILLVVVGVAAGTTGALLGIVPTQWRRLLSIGLLVTLMLAMLNDVFRVALAQLGVSTAWLYSVVFGGLTFFGAAVAFVASAGAAFVWARRGAFTRSDEIEEPEDRQARRRLAGTMTGILLLALPLLLGSFLSAVMGRVGIFLLMGLGLNIVVGYAGLLDLGYVAFFAVGAYAMGVLTAAPGSGSSIHVGMSFAEALPVVVVLAAVTGVLIGAPVLRLRGDYLAIVTLGFGEIARVLVTSDWLAPFLGGAQGLIKIPAPSIAFGSVNLDFRDPVPFYYLALGMCAFAGFVSWRLASSRVGRAWVAMREDEQVAEVMGISTVKYKLLAFATGAAIGSMSGALFAVQIGSLSPASFNILVSITALAIIILGGLGSLPGVLVGGLVLVGLPGFLREFEDFQLLIYGAVLVAIMLFRPQGLVPNVRRTRELLEDEQSQDSWVPGGAAAVVADPGAGEG